MHDNIDILHTKKLFSKIKSTELVSLHQERCVGHVNFKDCPCSKYKL